MCLVQAWPMQKHCDTKELDCGEKKTPPKSLKKHVQPTNFSDNGGKNSIFSLGGRLQDCRLWHTRQLGYGQDK